MVPSAVGVVVASSVATILFVAAFRKAVKPSPLERALRDLGLGPSVAGPGARLVPAVEATTAVLLPFSIGTALPVLLLSVLGVGFGLAGLAALGTGRSVTCACFGGAGEARLGWRQVALAPVWVAAGVLLARTEPVAGRTEWWALLAALGACLAWHLYPLAIGARDLRHDRIVRNNAVNAVVRRPVAALAAGRPDGTARNQESP